VHLLLVREVHLLLVREVHLMSMASQAASPAPAGTRMPMAYRNTMRRWPVVALVVA
jgi:hypothetical protein